LLHPSPSAAADDLKWRFLTCFALSIPVVYLWEPVQVAFGLGVDKQLQIAPGIVVGLAAACGLGA
jgi:hypothetical protein